MNDVEIELGFDPLNASDHPPVPPLDTDGDGIPDEFDLDDDNDGLSDEEENKLNTNPIGIDSDLDRLLDYIEIKLGTDPLNKDSDNDGFTDGEENKASTDPLDPIEFPIGVIADAGRDRILYPNQSTTFNGIYSIGKELNFSWDFDDSDGIQNDSTKERFGYKFVIEGIYTVTLTVSNGNTTDSDSCLVIVNEDMAASMDIIKSARSNPKYYTDRITIELIHRDNDTLILELNGTLKEGAIVSFTIDTYTMLVFEYEELSIKYDEIIIQNVDLIDLVNSNDKVPLYNISRLDNYLQITLYIPSFSVHKITIEKVKTSSIPGKQDRPREMQWLYSIFLVFFMLIFIISFGLAYSYKKTKTQKFYSSLKIDDETVIDFSNRPNKRQIDWEDYDSEI
jgi:PKD repeat protein